MTLPSKGRRRVALVSVIVADYDEAIAWYAEKLGFDLAEDTKLSAEKRWVVMAPAADGARQAERIGDQTGGRVFLVLHTDDVARDHARMVAEGVEFREEPRADSYGTVAVFADLYGNLWDLIQPTV